MNFKRFYIVSNHMQNFVRAWHAHKHELKAVSVLRGSVQVSIVKVDDWTKPSKNLEIKSVFLSISSKAVTTFIEVLRFGFEEAALCNKIDCNSES